jgi:hypothetical protein
MFFFERHSAIGIPPGKFQVPSFKFRVSISSLEVSDFRKKINRRFHRLRGSVARSPATTKPRTSHPQISQIPPINPTSALASVNVSIDAGAGSFSVTMGRAFGMSVSFRESRFCEGG